MRLTRWSVRALDDAIAARGLETFQNGANVVTMGGEGDLRARVAADGRARGDHRGRASIARTHLQIVHRGHPRLHLRAGEPGE